MKKKILIIAGWLLTWQAAAFIIHNDIIFAGPAETVKTLVQLAGTAEFWRSIGFSMLRISAGFLIGAAMGILLAFISYFHSLMQDILSPFVRILRSIPVASFVILLLIWAGSRNLSLFISLLVVFPILYMNVLEGLCSVDTKMRELVKVYRIPVWAQIRYILVPHVYPFLMSAVQLAVGLSWKSGAAAEVIGQPRFSIGNHLYQSKIYLDTAGLFAWTAVIILLSYGLEKLVMAFMKMPDPKRKQRSKKFPIRTDGTGAAETNGTDGTGAAETNGTDGTGAAETGGKEGTNYDD